MITFLIVTVFPVVFLLLYLIKQDKEKPEPKAKLAVCFALGMLGGVIGGIIQDVFAWLGIGNGYDSMFFGDIVCNAVVAAIFVSIVYFILWKYSQKNTDFDEFLDGPVYAVCISFGYQVMCDLFNMSTDEWLHVSLLTIMTMVAIYATALVIGYFYSMAHFGEMPLTSSNKFKMWAIPCAMGWGYNCICVWTNQSFFGLTIAIVVFAIMGYYINKKNKAIIAILKEKDSKLAQDGLR